MTQPELGKIAIPKIVETARSFTDVDMIIVSCADDPGVAEIRKFSRTFLLPAAVRQL